MTSALEDARREEPGAEAACRDEAHGATRTSGVEAGALARAARMFHAVGEVGRLRLLELLAQGEACVTELAEATGDGLSTVSQRLRVLHQERLVVRRREGKHIFYALSDEHVANLILNALEHASEEVAP
jgi:ArsR family transcriptional regulator, lead/cadmium/zinc/bismuth-responsive transcriptional repressor